MPGKVALAVCVLGVGCRKPVAAPMTRVAPPPAAAATVPAPDAAASPTPVAPVPISSGPGGPALSAEAEKALTQMVQAAVGEYLKRHKRFPKSVTELQNARLLEIIPDPPAGRKFVISPVDGRFSVQPK